MAAILGVIVGIPLGVVGLPALLNLFFDEPTIPVGGSWSEDGVIMWVQSWDVGETHPGTVNVTLMIRTTEATTINLSGFELELSEGAPIALEESPESGVLRPGFDLMVTLQFVLPGAQDGAEPRAVRLAEPKVRFALTEEDH